MLNPLRLAFAFLTRIPLPGNPQFTGGDFERSFLYFPVVGTFIGVALAGAGWAFLRFGADGRVISFILLFLSVLASGGLHLDGLADTADGLFSGKGKEEMLRIMKEPCAGPFGIVALILALIGKFAGFWHVLSVGNIFSIVPVFAFSRWGMTLASFKAVYPRATGTGLAFIGKVSPAVLIGSFFIALAVCLVVAGRSFALYPAITLILSVATRKFSDRKIGGVTGDILGAINETAETVMLLCVS